MGDRRKGWAMIVASRARAIPSEAILADRGKSLDARKVKPYNPRLAREALGAG
jgi:hypothetical protein